MENYLRGLLGLAKEMFETEGVTVNAEIEKYLQKILVLAYTYGETKGMENTVKLIAKTKGGEGHV